MVEEQLTVDTKIGNPWSILPIKNKKYAKDLVEVHLSERSLNSLTQFEEFPNLEVIWLNNNQVSYTIPKLLNLCVMSFFSCLNSYKIWIKSQATSA